MKDCVSSLSFSASNPCSESQFESRRYSKRPQSSKPYRSQSSSTFKHGQNGYRSNPTEFKATMSNFYTNKYNKIRKAQNISQNNSYHKRNDTENPNNASTLQNTRKKSENNPYFHRHYSYSASTSNKPITKADFSRIQNYEPKWQDNTHEAYSQPSKKPQKRNKGEGGYSGGVIMNKLINMTGSMNEFTEGLECLIAKNLANNNFSTGLKQKLNLCSGNGPVKAGLGRENKRIEAELSSLSKLSEVSKHSIVLDPGSSVFLRNTRKEFSHPNHHQKRKRPQTSHVYKTNFLL